MCSAVRDLIPLLRLGESRGGAAYGYRNEGMTASHDDGRRPPSQNHRLAGDGSGALGKDHEVFALLETADAGVDEAGRIIVRYVPPSPHDPGHENRTASGRDRGDKEG